MNYLDVKIDWKARMPESQAQKVEAHDAIDRFSVEWSRERPDLDFTYLATLGRILRLSAHLREAMDEWLEPYGITWEMFDLLASLQRSGYANGMRPTDLYEACMLSSGATTNRIDRAEKLNYAARRPDTEDGRSTRIALTKRGAGLTHRAMTRHSSCARNCCSSAARSTASSMPIPSGRWKNWRIPIWEQAAPSKRSCCWRSPPPANPGTPF